MIMDQVKESTPLSEYVRAMIAARCGDTAKFYKHLADAVIDGKLHNRAKTEADFLPYHNEQRFINIITKCRED